MDRKFQEKPESGGEFSKPTSKRKKKRSFGFKSLLKRGKP
jgi:hypothetical protein